MDLILAKNQFSKYSNSDFRPFQKEAIEFALKSEKKIVVIEAATGSGKSLIGLTAGASMRGVTYLVHSKILQNQITDDFPEAKSLFGRSNYTCLINPAISCDECHSTKSSPCDKKYSCLYEVKKREVLAAKYKILNYDYFLSEANYVGRFSGAPFVVIDEADNLENTLINFTTLTFTPYALRRMDMLDLAATLKMTSKFKDQLLESWKDFGRQAAYRVKAIIKKLSEDIEGWGQNLNDSQTKIIKERTRIVRLLEKIDLFLRNVDQDWILDIQEGKLIFRPLWMTPELANEYLWKHGSKFVLMSASFYPRNILAKCLGLDVADMDYHMVPSQFPVKNRPVYIYPVINLTAKTVDVEVPKLLPILKKIIDSRPNEKILIHAVSYSLANEITNKIDSLRIITHNGKNKQEVVDKFKESNDPLVLISPSCERGISLEGDLCRVIIIVKCPFLSLGDRVVSTRLYSGRIGQIWYSCTAALTILQMCGRAVRSKEDQAETFILDLQAKNLITKNPSFLPVWFLDALNFELPKSVFLD